MSSVLQHPKGVVRIEELANNTRKIVVEDADPSMVVTRKSCETSYGLPLIEKILRVKGPGALCDEITRDENPAYVMSYLRPAMLGYLPPAAFIGKRMLDFGCGSGASTMILSRLFPETHIVGIELQEDFVKIARMRAQHYGFENIHFLVSPNAEELPSDIGMFDFVSFSAVFEHLLPHERKQLVPKIWSVLKPGGVLFLNQTPHRYFPIEYHTTGIPLLNYMPDRLAYSVALRFSKRTIKAKSWEMLLRWGIRGGTETEVLRILRAAGLGQPRQLQPSELGMRTKLDLWYGAAGDLRRPMVKQAVKMAYRAVNFIFRMDTVPGLNMAIQKAA